MIDAPLSEPYKAPAVDPTQPERLTMTDDRTDKKREKARERETRIRKIAIITEICTGSSLTPVHKWVALPPPCLPTRSNRECNKDWVLTIIDPHQTKQGRESTFYCGWLCLGRLFLILFRQSFSGPCLLVHPGNVSENVSSCQVPFFFGGGGLFSVSWFRVDAVCVCSFVSRERKIR